MIAALWGGGIALLLSLLSLLQIAWLRSRLRARERLAERCLNKWRPMFNAILAGDEGMALPPLEAREGVYFLKLWLHFQISLRGGTRELLNNMARRLGADARARSFLEHGSLSERALAALALGYLADRSCLETMRRQSVHPDRLLSFHARWALIQIDPEVEVRHAIRALVAGEWSVREAAGVLQESMATVEGAFLEALPRESEDGALILLLQLADALALSPPGEMLEPLLRHPEMEIKAGALKLCGDPTLKAAVLELMGHEDWRVRLQAVRALGRFAEPEDVFALAHLLTDPEWWVRYRSAQALAQLPFLRAPQVVALAEAANDPYARDIVRQVLAESAAR